VLDQIDRKIVCYNKISELAHDFEFLYGSMKSIDFLLCTEKGVANG